MQKDKTKYKILIAEDNLGDFVLVEDYIEEMILAPEIKHTKTFQETKAALEDKACEIDVILLDLSLADKEGERLITDVLKVSGNIPTIILTGYPDVNFAIKSLALGVSDYLLKDSLNATTLYKSIIYNIERNKTLVSLKESEQRYADLFHLSPLPMCVYDLETLEFLDVNKATISHYGYSLEEFLTMTIKDIRPKEEVEKLEKALELSKGKEDFYFQGVFKHLTKNGDIIDVDIRSNIINYKGKRAEVVLINDITERIIHTNAIEQQNAKLKEIAWLQSHVVRAPLSRMMGLIHAMVDDDVLTPEEKNQYLKYILESAEELDEIVKDVVSKSQKIEIKE
jgi:PAS domain S-box-containing protein